MSRAPETPPDPVGATDFGRELNGDAARRSLADALRQRSEKAAAKEAFNRRLALGLAGFLGGLVLVVPAVLWLTQKAPAARPAEARPASGPAPIVRGPPVTRPAQSPQAAAGLPLGDRSQLDAARRQFRAGDIAGARKILVLPEFADNGEARFMLAETYDPNVLAAFGAHGVQAEAQTARRHYEAALARGVPAATQRLEALK